MPRDKARYILHPDFVISANDQQRHYVSARALAKLYKVPFGNCIIISSVDTGRSRGLKLEDYVHLHPQSDGNYTLPAGGV